MQGGSDEGIPLGLISRMIIPICSESSYDLYRDYIEELIPLIVYSLSLDDATIKHICLKMIKKLLEEVDQSKINYKELLNSLMSCISASMSTDIKNLALICIASLIKTNFSELILYKPKIMKKMRHLLDDRKRSTRKLARSIQ